MKSDVLNIANYEVEFTLGSDDTVWTADFKVLFSDGDYSVTLYDSETPLTRAQRYDIELYIEDNGDAKAWFEDHLAEKGDNQRDIRKCE